jgi:hypothetical protein
MYLCPNQGFVIEFSVVITASVVQDKMGQISALSEIIL